MQSSAGLWRDIAVLRGLEHDRPESERLVEDPISLRLLPAASRWLLRLLQTTGLADAILARGERDLPGVIGNLLCRTRHMDDVLREAAWDGVDQVVILGVGFDTRAYRMAELEGVQVIEVDHPAVQEAKRQALDRASVAIPPTLALVGIDFERDDLAAALADADFGILVLFTGIGVAASLVPAWRATRVDAAAVLRSC